MPRTVPLDDCQPSQLLIDAAKLRDVLEWLDADDPVYDPLPVLAADDLPTDPEPDPGATYVLADGHTRALAAVLCGVDELRVVDVPPSERDDLDLEVYAACVGWCLEADVTTPRDLVGRVVSTDTHREEWIERCRALESESEE